MNFSTFFIGHRLVTLPLIMAPLHDITDYTFRNTLLEIGGVGLVYSEMISSEALIRNIPKAQLMTKKAPGCLYTIQLSGHKPDSLAIAAEIAQNAGADIIDLNMGCPSHNITNNGAGSALLRNIKIAECCIKNIVKSVKIPVTVKMRTGWNDIDNGKSNYIDFIHMCENNNVKAIAVHPRTKVQQYKGNADWDLIKKAVDLNTNMSIIGNGDINSPSDAINMFKETGCHGVMIGRAALLNPWIFQQILNPKLVVTDLQKIALCKNIFIKLSCELSPIEAVHKMKKIGSWLTKGISNGANFRSKLNTCNSVEMLFSEINKL